MGGERALVLPLGGDGTDLADFPGEDLPSLRSGGEMEWGKEGEGGGKQGGRTGIGL